MVSCRKTRTRSRVYYTAVEVAWPAPTRRSPHETHEFGGTHPHTLPVGARAPTSHTHRPRHARSTNDQPNDRLLGSRETTATGRRTILGTVAASRGFCCRVSAMGETIGSKSKKHTMNGEKRRGENISVIFEDRINVFRRRVEDEHELFFFVNMRGFGQAILKPLTVRHAQFYSYDE